MFYICSTQRNSGFEITHIPQLDLIKLSDYYNVYDPYFWVYTMRLIDNEYVAHIREINKPKDSKDNGSFSKGKKTR
jgi:hypothetical protein